MLSELVSKRYQTSTTSIVKIANDILSYNDCDKINAIVLLHLSAAFDTADHDILLPRLNTDVGVKGTALSWFRSYLSGRSQVVSCAGELSSSRTVTCSVPEGSVLGPLLFCLYTRPLEQVLKRHTVNYHFYADDTQIYLSFDPSEAPSAVSNLHSFLSDVRGWIAANFLKLLNKILVGYLLINVWKRKSKRSLTWLDKD